MNDLFDIATDKQIPRWLQVLAVITVVHFFILWTVGFVSKSTAPVEPTATHTYQVKFSGHSTPRYLRPMIGWYITYGLYIEFGLLGVGAVATKILLHRRSHQCPNCKRLRARKDIGQEMLDMFYKTNHNFREKEIVMHYKYRVQHICRYCEHKWTKTEVRRH